MIGGRADLLPVLGGSGEALGQASDDPVASLIESETRHWRLEVGRMGGHVSVWAGW